MPLRIIKGTVELGEMDPERNAYPIRDDSGYIIGYAETYEHGEDLRRAVNNHNELIRALSLLRFLTNMTPVNAAQEDADKVLARARL